MNSALSTLQRIAILLAVVVAIASRGFGDEPRRVAVLADGVGLGHGPQARLDAWPVQLARMLGKGWIVKGLARGGASLDPSAQRFVMSLPEWGSLQAFEPDIVVIALGASDAVDATFKGRPRIPSGLDQMCTAISAMPKKPKVYLCLPPPAAEGWRRAGSYEVASKEIVAMLDATGAKHGATMIDTRAPLVGHDEHLVTGFLPDTEAARIIAAAVHKGLTGRDAPIELGPYRRTVAPKDLVATEFIRAGVPVRAQGAERWSTNDGALEHREGGGSVLLAPIDTGSGDFNMRAEVWIEGGERNGPRFGVDGNWISLENEQGNVVADGEIFRGRPYIARATDVIKRGAWMTLEIRRVGVDLEFLADNALLVSIPSSGERFARFVIEPQNSKLRVRSWSVEIEPAAPTAPAIAPSLPSASGASPQQP